METENTETDLKSNPLSSPITGTAQPDDQFSGDNNSDSYEDLLSKLVSSLSDIQHGIGIAAGDGDCFFDSVAQALNEKFDTQEYTHTSIRRLCNDYAKNLESTLPSATAKQSEQNQQNNWIFQAFHENYDLYTTYLSQGGLNAKEAIALKEQYKFGDGLAIWGEQEIDARIICKKLGIKIHIVELHEEALNNQDVPDLLHQLINESGVHQLEACTDYIYQGENTINICVGHSHFLPILKKTTLEANASVEGEHGRNDSSTNNLFDVADFDTLTALDLADFDTLIALDLVEFNTLIFDLHWGEAQNIEKIKEFFGFGAQPSEDNALTKSNTYEYQGKNINNKNEIDNFLLENNNSKILKLVGCKVGSAVKDVIVRRLDNLAKLMFIDTAFEDDDEVIELINAIGANHTLIELLLINSRHNEDAEENEAFGEAIKNMLIRNKTLETLDISKNIITENEILAITEGLKANQTLKELILREGCIYNKATQQLALALECHPSLLILSLGNSFITHSSASQIITSLQENDTLKILDLNSLDDCFINKENGTEIEGNEEEFSKIKMELANNIAQMLRVNKTLKALYIDNSLIEEKEAEIIIKGLQKNTTLLCLGDPSYNQPDSEFNISIITDKTLEEIKKLLHRNRILTHAPQRMNKIILFCNKNIITNNNVCIEKLKKTIGQLSQLISLYEKAVACTELDMQEKIQEKINPYKIKLQTYEIEASIHQPNSDYLNQALEFYKAHKVFPPPLSFSLASDISVSDETSDSLKYACIFKLLQTAWEIPYTQSLALLILKKVVPSSYDSDKLFIIPLDLIKSTISTISIGEKASKWDKIKDNLIALSPEVLYQLCQLHELKKALKEKTGYDRVISFEHASQMTMMHVQNNDIFALAKTAPSDLEAIYNIVCGIILNANNTAIDTNPMDNDPVMEYLLQHENTLEKTEQHEESQTSSSTCTEQMFFDHSAKRKDPDKGHDEKDSQLTKKSKF